MKKEHQIWIMLFPICLLVIYFGAVRPIMEVNKQRAILQEKYRGLFEPILGPKESLSPKEYPKNCGKPSELLGSSTLYVDDKFVICIF